MILFLIIGIVLGVLGLNFALQNTQEVNVAFFAWEFTAPLALIIFGSMLLSIVLALIAMIPAATRDALDRYALRRELRRAQQAPLTAPSSDVQATA